MQDAYGGILNLVIIVMFLLIVMGTLGLVVSYTKAFKMKNIVISNFERYEDANCIDSDSACFKKIVQEAKGIAYAPGKSINCHDLTKSDTGLFCYGMEPSANGDGVVYTVITQVDITFPIIDKIAGFRIFQVSCPIPSLQA